MRRCCRGAAAALLTALSGTVLAGGVAAADLGAVLVSGERAQSAADAAAHAAASVLASSAEHAAIVDQVDVLQDPADADGRACGYDRSLGLAEVSPLCREAVEEARRVAAGVPGADLDHLRVTRDPRDSTLHDPARIRLRVVAWVTVERRLPLLGRVCGTAPPGRASLCTAVAASAAQEAAPG